MSKSLVWMRRSLRLHDHTALSFSTQNYDATYLVFVFDKNILDKLDDNKDHRVTFIHDTLLEMQKKLDQKIYILYGDPIKLIPRLAKELEVEIVCTHEDYELYAKNRDHKVEGLLKKDSIEFKKFKDHIIFDASEVRTGSGDFYKVFTPYKNSWLKLLREKEEVIQEKKIKINKINSVKVSGFGHEISLTDMGFERTEKRREYNPNPKKFRDNFQSKVDKYHDKRDFPAIEGTSKLSAYLRFGQVSVRELIRSHWPTESEGEDIWLSELCWRDFYFGLLKTFPHVEKYAYNDKYEKVPYLNNKKDFKAWCEGRTGVPIVDAGMRELNETGWMHNRVRMIVASYLTKILIIDWRWGEEYFAKKLIDYDLSANNGGWQWSASTGCDAAPYFRVFNPYRQSERFDKEAKYILKYCPELKNLPPKFIHEPIKITEKVEHQYDFNHGKDYPKPIAPYSERRKEVIQLFKDAPYE